MIIIYKNIYSNNTNKNVDIYTYIYKMIAIIAEHDNIHKLR